jgi:hypothetical protein
MAPSQNDRSELSNWDRLVATMAAYHAGNIAASLEGWSDGAIVKLVGAPPGEPDEYHGKDQIGAWLARLYADHFEIQEELLQDEGDTLVVRALSWSDLTRRLGVAPLVATEVYVYCAGKIQQLTWTISPETPAKLAAAAPPP